MKIEIIAPKELTGRTLEIILDTSRILKRLGRNMIRENETGIKVGQIYEGDLIKIRFVW